MSKKYRGIKLDGSAVELAVDGDIISSVSPIPPAPDLPYLLPVLVDLQHNGALGQAYNNLTGSTADVDTLHRIADHLLSHGVGRVLATFTTTDYPRLEKAAAALVSRMTTITVSSPASVPSTALMFIASMAEPAAEARPGSVWITKIFCA